jgi:hypothetical protein
MPHTNAAPDLVQRCNQREPVTAANPILRVGPSSASLGADPRWPCPPHRRIEFYTDPIIYGRDVPLRRIAAPANPHVNFEIQREGLQATVTFLNPRGLIRHRFEYIRGKTWGWSLQSGQSCRTAR